MIEAIAAVQVSAFSLKTAKEALIRTRSHHEKCNVLVSGCQTLVAEACVYLQESPTRDNHQAHLNALMSVCEKVRSLVTDIADKGTTWKLLNQAAITQTITEAESELDDALRIFNVSAQNLHTQLQHDFTIALRQDNERIKLFLETLFHNPAPLVKAMHSVPKHHTSGSPEEAPASTSRNWSIQERQIKLCTTPNLLGTGEIGRVYAGNIGNQAIVMKQIHTEVAQKLLGNEKRRKILESRIQSWTQMQHPHLAEFVGASLDLAKPFFVVKFYPFGNVHDYLKSYPTRNRLSILHHAALGMQFLHSRNIIHANLKPGNLLVDTNHFVVVTDYQIPQKRHSHAFTTSRPQGRYTYHRRSLPYVAPERFDNAELALAVDVYSFAIIGWEVCTAQVPFAQVDPSCFYETVVVEQKRPPNSDAIDTALWTSMQNWWAHDATSRPQFSTIESELRGYVDEKVQARQAKVNTTSKRVRVVETSTSPSRPDGARAERARSLSPAALSPTPKFEERSDTSDRQQGGAPRTNNHVRQPSKVERLLGENIPAHLIAQQSRQRSATVGSTNLDSSTRRQSILSPVRRLPSDEAKPNDTGIRRPIVAVPTRRRASMSHNEMTPITEMSTTPASLTNSTTNTPTTRPSPQPGFSVPRDVSRSKEANARPAVAPVAAVAPQPSEQQRSQKIAPPTVPPQRPNTPTFLPVAVHTSVTVAYEPSPAEPELKPEKSQAKSSGTALTPVRRQPTAVRQKEIIMQTVQSSPAPPNTPVLPSSSIALTRHNSVRRNLPQPPRPTPTTSSTPERGRTPEPAQNILGRRGLPELPDLPLLNMPANVPVRVLTPDLPQITLASRQDLQLALPFPMMSSALTPDRPATPDRPQAILDMTPRRPSHRVMRLEVSDSARQAIAFSLHALMNSVTFHNLIRNILICYPDWLKSTKQTNRNPHAPHVYKDRAKSHVITFETILTMTTWATGPSDVTDSAGGVNGCRTLIYVLASCSMAELAHRERPGRPYLFVPKFVDKVMSKPVFQNTLEELAQDLWMAYGSKLSTSTVAVAELPTALEDCIEQLINDYAPLLTE